MELIVILYAITVEAISLTKGSYVWANQIERAIPRILNFILAMAYMVYSVVWCFSNNRNVQAAGVLLVFMSIAARFFKISRLRYRLDAITSMVCLTTVLIVRIGEIT